jgi:hypothetical protein
MSEKNNKAVNSDRFVKKLLRNKNRKIAFFRKKCFYRKICRAFKRRAFSQGKKSVRDTADSTKMLVYK